MLCFFFFPVCVSWATALWCGSPSMCVPRPLRQLMGQSPPSCGACSVTHLSSTLPATSTLQPTMCLRSRASQGSPVESWQVGSCRLTSAYIYFSYSEHTNTRPCLSVSCLNMYLNHRSLVVLSFSPQRSTVLLNCTAVQRWF